MRYASPPIIYFFSLLTFCSLFSQSILAVDEINKSPSSRLIFGIAPFMSPTSLVKRMAPLREYLSESTGIDVLIETSTSAKVFKERTLNGRYDIVFTNPTFSLMAMDKGGFQILATQKKKISGHFVVLKNSKIQNIKELEGKLIGSPPKIGFLGQLIEPYLDTIGFEKNNKPKIKYFHSHKDVIAALRFGDTDASLIVSFMEKHLLKKGFPLRTIHRTEGYPGMTMLSKIDMPEELANKIRKSLFSLDQNDQGKIVLKKISMPGFKKLNLKQLDKVRPYLPHKKNK